MFEGHDQALAVLLREAGLLSPAALARLGDECRATNESLADAAIKRGLGRVFKRLEPDPGRSV